MPCCARWGTRGTWASCGANSPKFTGRCAGEARGSPPKRCSRSRARPPGRHWRSTRGAGAERERVAGVDEAGRGRLAGPVVAAAVILDPRRRIRGLADSKVLSSAERARLAPIIRARALAWAVGWADRDEIDCLNILEATLLAMRRALLALPACPTHVQVDGHRCPCLGAGVVWGPGLVTAVAAAGMPAVAVTDQSTLFAMVKFYREALKAGVKPLIGVDLLVREEGERQPPTRLTLLCQSQAGYRNLTHLITRAYLEGQERGTPRVERGWLSAQRLTGVIGLSCAAAGDIGRALVHAREHDAEPARGAWLQLLPRRSYPAPQALG